MNRQPKSGCESGVQNMDDLPTDLRFFLKVLDSRVKAVAEEGHFALATQGAQFMISYAPTALVGYHRLRVIQEMQAVSCAATKLKCTAGPPIESDGESKAATPDNDSTGTCSSLSTDDSMFTALTSHSHFPLLERTNAQNSNFNNRVEPTTNVYMILPRPQPCERDVTQYERAIVDASLAVGRQPQSTRSYIELGYLYELQSYDLCAYETYLAGLRSVRKTDLQYWQLSLAAEDVRRRLDIRIDFVKRLPLEILDAIFCNLGEIDRRTSLNVCKEWRTKIFRCSKTWSSISFGKLTFNGAVSIFARKIQEIEEIRFRRISNNQMRRIAVNHVCLKDINSLIFEGCTITPDQLIKIASKATHLTQITLSFPLGSKPAHIHFILSLFPKLRSLTYTLDDKEEWPTKSLTTNGRQLPEVLQLNSLTIICPKLEQKDLCEVLRRSSELKYLCVHKVLAGFSVPKTVQTLIINRQDVLSISDSPWKHIYSGRSAAGCRRLASDNRCSSRPLPYFYSILKKDVETLEVLDICFSEPQPLDRFNILSIFLGQSLSHLALSNVPEKACRIVGDLIRHSPGISFIEFHKTDILKEQIIIDALMSLRALRAMTVQDAGLKPGIFLQFFSRSEVQAHISSISFRNVRGLCDKSLSLLGHMKNLNCAVLHNMNPATHKPFPLLLHNFRRTGEMRRLELAGFGALDDTFLKNLSRVRGLRVFKIEGAGHLTDEGVNGFLEETEYSLKRVDFIKCGRINRIIRR